MNDDDLPETIITPSVIITEEEKAKRIVGKLHKSQPRKPVPKKNTEETKEQIIKLLEQLRQNILGRGSGVNQIKELRVLTKQTTIKKELNDGLDYIETGIKRRWYTEIYNRIGELSGKVKGL